jgi:lysine 2,3-aminomutase
MVPDWKRDISRAFTSPEEALAALHRPLPPSEALSPVARAFSVRIPRYYLSLIDPDDPADPIALQCLPAVEELLTSPTDLEDAVGDEAMSPVPGIVQKHGNRVILLVSNTCTMYCRFCFRRPVASGHAVDGLRDRLREAFHHLETHPDIHEVILSGGDPLTLEDDALHALLTRLRAIPHVRLLRIHTRAPVTLPSRVTPGLVEALRPHRPLYLVTHFNHPRELTPLAREGLARLIDAGIPLLNQSVLLKGVNDSADTLAELCWGLLAAGVTPYYLHHCDRTPGTGMFRTSIARGREIMAQLKARIPGHGLPRYVLDLPGGHGKVSLELEAARDLGDGRWEVTTPDDLAVVYRDEPEP